MKMKPELKPYSEYADIIKVKEFLQCKDSGYFIPWDGDGYYGTGSGESNISVWSNVPVPEWATHVAWYNK